MKNYLKISLVLIITVVFLGPVKSQAQITLEDIKNLDITKILGQSKILSVEKGFSPTFFLGKNKINSVGILGEKLKGVNILGDILGKKNAGQILGLYKTYKTGLVVFKILGAAGSIVTVASTVKGITDEQNFNDQTVKQMLYPAIGSLVTGIVTKIITKKASYKAVDVFNGMVKKTIKDILSVKPASQNLGLGLYVNL